MNVLHSVTFRLKLTAALDIIVRTKKLMDFPVAPDM